MINEKEAREQMNEFRDKDQECYDTVMEWIDKMIGYASSKGLPQVTIELADKTAKDLFNNEEEESGWDMKEPSDWDSFAQRIGNALSSHYKYDIDVDSTTINISWGRY